MYCWLCAQPKADFEYLMDVLYNAYNNSIMR